MSHSVHLDVFYPYPPERIWQVLTDRRALATWMMENNFEPKLGHKFQFYSQHLPGLTTTIQCEVMELEAPSRLVYTWREAKAEPSLVIWTLTTVVGGTQLRLKHHQYSYTTAIAASNRSEVDQIDRNPRLFLPESCPNSLRLDAAYLDSSWRYQTGSHSADAIAAIECAAPQTVAWNYLLNQRLPIVLMQDEY